MTLETACTDLGGKFSRLEEDFGIDCKGLVDQSRSLTFKSFPLCTGASCTPEEVTQAARTIQSTKLLPNTQSSLTVGSITGVQDIWTCRLIDEEEFLCVKESTEIGDNSTIQSAMTDMSSSTISSGADAAGDGATFVELNYGVHADAYKTSCTDADHKIEQVPDFRITCTRLFTGNQVAVNVLILPVCVGSTCTSLGQETSEQITDLITQNFDFSTSCTVGNVNDPKPFGGSSASSLASGAWSMAITITILFAAASFVFE